MSDAAPDPLPILTIPMRLVLRELLTLEELGDEPVWSGKLAEATTVDRKSVERLLHRLEAAGWATSEVESPEAARARGKGARRFWNLTPAGTEAVQERLERKRLGRAASELTPQSVGFGHGL